MPGKRYANRHRLRRTLVRTNLWATNREKFVP